MSASGGGGVWVVGSLPQEERQAQWPEARQALQELPSAASLKTKLVAREGQTAIRAVLRWSHHGARGAIPTRYALARRLAAAFSRAAAARSAGVFFLGCGGAHVRVVLHECRSGTAAFLPTARPTRFEDRRAGHALPYHARGARCALCAAAGATRSCER